MARIWIPILLSCVVASAQSPDLHSKILRAVEEREYAAAIADLRSLYEREPRLFRERNYDYLQGRLCERLGDLECAAANFAKAASRGSVLHAYALWHLSHLSRTTGNLLAERIYLMRLMADRPDSMLADAAKRRLARSWFDSGDHASAIREFTRGEGGDGSPDRGEQVLLAKAYMYSDDPASARTIFTALLNSGPNPAQPDDNALEAARGPDLLDVGPARFGKAVGTLSDYEHLRRAQVYQFNRDFHDARLHFEAIIEHHPDSGIVPDALYQIGRGYFQSSDFVTAAVWYARALEQFPEHPVAKDALLQLASAYARIGRHRESIGRYERFIEKYPEDERVERAYLNIIDELRDSGSEAEALVWTEKTQAAFSGKTAEALALFARVKIRLARSDWQNALTDLQRLNSLSQHGGPNVPGSTTREEVAFLTGYVLEQLRRYPEAIDSYLSISDGRSEYYGWRATERLRALAADANSAPSVAEKRDRLSRSESATPDERRRVLQSVIRLTAEAEARAERIEELRKLYETIPAYRAPKPFGPQTLEERPAGSIASALADLGLFDEAASEIETAASASAASASYSLADAYRKGDRGDRAYSFIERQARLPFDYQVELIPRQYSEMLYPAPYVDRLLKEATPRGVDPRLLLAIMRQESAFRPNVKSNAAARGLMQFISATADRIAGDLQMNNFDHNELFYPPTAIRLGSKYVADLFGQFPGQPEAVAASYNGGEDNMKRWLARSHSNLAEHYVPEIAFAQTKDYVARVIANYRMYTLLYDEQLRRK